jgi:hypothetical protein
MVVERGDVADLVCNSWGAVVDTGANPSDGLDRWPSLTRKANAFVPASTPSRENFEAQKLRLD